MHMNISAKKKNNRFITLPLWSHGSPSNTTTPVRGEFSSTTVTPSEVTSTLPADDTAVMVTKYVCQQIYRKNGVKLQAHCKNQSCILLLCKIKSIPIFFCTFDTIIRLFVYVYS